MQPGSGCGNAIYMARKWSRADEFYAASLVDQCIGSTRQLKQVHAHVVVHGQSQNNFIAAKLVRAFAGEGSLGHARAITDDLDSPNIFVWTAMIRGYSVHASSDNHSSKDAISIYERVHQLYPSVRPLPFTLSSVLKVCSQLHALVEGRQVHAHAFKHEFQLDSRVQTTLMNFYGKCSRLSDARKVFDDMCREGELDLQAWNTMIGIYAEAGEMEHARHLFDEMPGYNTHTYVAMINGYAHIGKMELARQLLNVHLPPNEKNCVITTAMIVGYAHCGELSAARQMFDELDGRDVALWNAMITAYTHAGLAEEAVALFQQMIDHGGRKNAQPNQTTIAIIASACVQSGSPSQASWLGAYFDSHGTELLNGHTAAALIDLHSKRGDLRRAYDIFSRFKPRDVVCYSAMIAGFGIHGRGEDAIRLFEELQEANKEPDSICFVSLLTACGHSGKVEEGRHYFELMKNKYGIAPMVEHYMCLVDLLGRAGRVEEAYALITDGMEVGVMPHAGVWGALLSACRSYGHIEIGEVALRCLIEIEPENAGNYVLMSNIYAKAKMWDEVSRVRAAMRRRGIRKQPGWSWLETEGCRDKKFMTGEAYDSDLELVLQVWSWELKVHGYVSDMQETEEY